MTSFYVGLVDKGDEGWGVTFPDLPGCTSAGETMAELFSMGAEAVSLWAEAALADGEVLPEPRTVDALLADQDVQDTIQAVGPVSFLQIPLHLETGRSVRAEVSFDAELLDAIDTAAMRRGWTRSSFLASAALEKIKNEI